MKTAIVNKIIPFSNVDGPGNRTAIFFQGCSFACLYCHNPETIHLCRHCGECVEQCPVNALSMKNGKVVWDDEICCECDTCIKVCPHLSSPKTKLMKVADIVEYIKPHVAFIEGITVSGGECMLQADFLLELFKEMKKMGLTCLIDSNGTVDFRKHTSLLDISDGVMLDVKAFDNDFHRQICKYDNLSVKQNLDYLQSIHKLLEVRTVLLPNQDEQNEATVNYVSKCLKEGITYKLLRFRPYGVRFEGVEYFGKESVSEEYAEKFKNIVLKNGHNDIIIV
ncbi:pyruvate formate lyase activating enzyme [Breznakia sp. PF5-3]|uniref:YjjW family glycine radical enzyme activase n=1 Tax=unclassified Breznakia TaxID=2623764 RepID=UPI00240734F9|nr:MULTISPECIES: YjjW family glycine radical enzyme activase [unclassified Breznakia]MDF9825663.1 pyruvate formate lyase activating enzyme [Breznakia sp. PM6-1]MDF9836497.1 pyruvate formate lyase activating enzyme [Breznakia sp. PF5-3]MDF9838642.1 pyruvate formate lyase activating enzyme [Breznakia sp. PFB2-8]MDF9860673.1 pyruvate formate lyase activating enzyme [Breznakia sp. PH5-24]